MIIETKQNKKFLGQTEFKLEIPKDTSEEVKIILTNGFKKYRHFHNRMLRAYLKGKEFFFCGFEYVNDLRQPIKHKVEYLIN